MATSLKTGFAQISSCCPKNLVAQNLEVLQPPSPPGPYAYDQIPFKKIVETLNTPKTMTIYV